LSCPPKPKCEPPENVRLKLLHQPHRVKHLAHDGTPKRCRRCVGRGLFGPPGPRNFARFLEDGGGATHQGEGRGSLFRRSGERGAVPSAAGAGSVELFPLQLERGAWSCSLCSW